VSADHAYELHAIVARCGTSGEAFDHAVEGWLDKYGHRGLNELDIANPRWHEAPEAVKAMAGQMGVAVHDPTSAKRVRERAEAKLGRIPPPMRWILRYLIGKARDGFRIRELGKSALVATFGMHRHLMLEFGRRFVAAGLLDHRDDVFMLTAPDVRLFAVGDWDGKGARELAADRRRQWVAWSESEPAADVILEGSGRLAPARTPAPPHGPVISGIGVSPGVAENAARKLHDPSQVSRLRSGGVLVARATDPGWTPLFLSADGIVVEIGGYLSHAAIVAREFGLPAVVNAAGSFGHIRDGERVRVDGDAGVVTLIERG
jgi:pyruvate,water dikinase